MKRILPILVILSFMACSDGENNTSEAASSENVGLDSIRMDTNHKNSVFPLHFDTTYLQYELADLKELSSKEIRKLLKVFNKQKPDADLYIRDYEYYIERFLFIDSLKKAKAYKNYPWDIGMIQYASSFVIDTIQINQDTSLLIWGLEESTYEACPYGTWKLIYLTVFEKEVAKTTLLVAEDSGGGDPPAFGSDLTTSILESDFSLIRSNENVSGEEYDGKVDADTGITILQYQYKNGQFIQVKS